MRVASFNVESLFDRAKALSLPTWEDGRKILEAYAQTNALLNEPVYTPAIKAQLVDLLVTLGLKKEDQSKDGFALLRHADRYDDIHAQQGRRGPLRHDLDNRAAPGLGRGPRHRGAGVKASYGLAAASYSG